MGKELGQTQAVPVVAGLVLEVAYNLPLLLDLMIEGAHVASFALLAFTAEALLGMTWAYITGRRLVHKRMVEFLEHGVGVLALDSFYASRPPTSHMESYV